MPETDGDRIQARYGPLPIRGAEAEQAAAVPALRRGMRRRSRGRPLPDDRT